MPFDTESPFVTSGIRIATPAVTTRGFDADGMREIAAIINLVLIENAEDKVYAEACARVQELSARFPLYAR